MRKSDKKRDNQLRQLLTDVCDFALLHNPGYQWITHQVNYKRFPESLVITLMFSDQATASVAKQQGKLLTLISQKLDNASLNLKNIDQHIRFESPKR